MNNPPTPSMEGLLTIVEAARICGVPTPLVSAWIYHNRLPCFTMKGSNVCAIHPVDLEWFCEENNIKGVNYNDQN